MKKIFIAIMAAAAIGFSACTGSTEGASGNDSISVEDVTKAIQSGNAEDAKSYIEKAQAYCTKLQEEGKIDEAKKYLEDLQKSIAENKDKITSLGIPENIVSAVANFDLSAITAKEKVEGAVENAKDKIGEAATDAVDKAKEEATNAVNNAVDKAKEDAANAANKAVDKAKEDAANAANKAKEEVSSKVDAAKDAVKDKLGF